MRVQGVRWKQREGQGAQRQLQRVRGARRQPRAPPGGVHLPHAHLHLAQGELQAVPCLLRLHPQEAVGVSALGQAQCCHSFAHIPVVCRWRIL